MILNHTIIRSLRLGRQSSIKIANVCVANGSQIPFSTSVRQREQQGRPNVGSTPSESAAQRMEREREENVRTHFGFRDVAEEEKAGLGK